MFMMVYVTSARAAGIKKDRALATMFVLALLRGQHARGSPAAGGGATR